MNTIWLIFRNLFPVMHHLPNIWLRNADQTDLYVLDGNGLHDLLVNVFGEHVPHWCRVDGRGPGKGTQNVAFYHEIFGGIGRVHLLE